MLAAIVKRELIDLLLSLRFGLALVLTVGLTMLILDRDDPKSMHLHPVAQGRAVAAEN